MTGKPSPPDETGDRTSILLERARAGDRHALEELFARHIPPLRRWAAGRLPRWARDIADTTDLVQDTVMASLRHLGAFEPRGDGALQAYLRQALINRVRNELRRAASRPVGAALEPDLPGDGTSPLEAAIERETLERYEAALAQLPAEDRDAVISRVEFGLSYAEIGRIHGKSSADAARMKVVRALLKLARIMSGRV